MAGSTGVCPPGGCSQSLLKRALCEETHISKHTPALIEAVVRPRGVAMLNYSL